MLRNLEENFKIEKNAKEVVINFVIFFNECKQYVDYDKINNMEHDVLLLTYEMLLERKYQELLEYEKIKQQNKV